MILSNDIESLEPSAGSDKVAFLFVRRVLPSLLPSSFDQQAREVSYKAHEFISQVLGSGR